MQVTPELVRREYDWIANRSTRTVSIINDVRERLGVQFDTDVSPVSQASYRAELTVVFTDGDRAVNIAALVAMLRELDVEDDYPGFVVDELLGRELAGMIAGEQPLRLLGEATFHYADIHVDGAGGENAGVDDLDAALAAGFQTRLPGWEWRRTESPFGLAE